MQYLLSGAVLKQSSKAGEVSMFVLLPDSPAPTLADLAPRSVDAYGTLVSARLYVPSDLSALNQRHLKISHQRHLTDDGSHPLPIYCAIRHELPNLEELEQEQEQLMDRMKKGFGLSGKHEKEKQQLEERRQALVVREGRWMWFEVSPYGTCCRPFFLHPCL